jgi:hypothetical protein
MPPCNVVPWLAWRARGEERGDREEALLLLLLFLLERRLVGEKETRERSIIILI